VRSGWAADTSDSQSDALSVNLQSLGSLCEPNRSPADGERLV